MDVNRILNVGYQVHGAATDTALIFVAEDGRATTYSYDDVERHANAFALRVLADGACAGDAIGILAENSAHFVFCWLGVLRAGMSVVPVNHKLPAMAIAHILRDADVKHVYCDDACRGLVPDRRFSSPLVVAVDANTGVPMDRRLVDPAGIAVVLYTSGSTGVPKGVPMTHAGYGWTVQTRLRGGPHRHHRLLVAAPLYHINALGAVTFSLAAGASVVLLQRFDVRHYIEAIGRFGCTWLTSVPAMLAMVVRETELLARTSLATVRIVRMGSAPVSVRLFQQVRGAFGQASLSNQYGTTEGGPLVFGPGPDGELPPDGAAGWPLTGIQVRLVNRRGEEVNDEGVLVLKTPATMTGYLNLPDKSREVLSSDGWYFTGDVFRRDARGAYWFVSRIDDMFVCGGENIHPQEVERVLESHPAVQQACVVPVVDDIKGAKPVAFVVLRAGAGIAEQELKTHALRNGPAYQHPRRVYFVDALPLAGTNKIDRKALIQLAATQP